MQKIMCCRHQINPLTFIKFTSEQAQLWCKDCLLEQEENDGTIQMKNIISVNKALEQPDYLISRLNISGENTDKLKGYQQNQKSVLEKQIKDLEFSMEELKKQFQSILNDINEKMKKIIQIRQQIQIELQNIIKYEEFQQIINDMNQLESNINPDTVQQIEQRLFKYLSNIQENGSSQLNQQLSKFMNNFYFNKNKEIGLFTEPNKIIQLNQNLLNQYTIIKQNMGSYYKKFGYNFIENQFDIKLQSIMKEKTKKEVLDYQLIYKGSNQDIKFSQFSQILNGRSNLLMIFKLSDQQIFGFYASSQSDIFKQQNQGYYSIKDSTNQQFLISQSKNELLPKKNVINNDNLKLSHENFDIQFVEQQQERYVTIDLNNFEGIQKDQNMSFGGLFQGCRNNNLVELEIYQVVFQ